MSKNTTVTVRFCQAFADASGFPAVIDVLWGNEKYSYAMELVGGERKCTLLTRHPSNTACAKAKERYAKMVEALGPDYVERNHALYVDANTKTCRECHGTYTPSGSGKDDGFCCDSCAHEFDEAFGRNQP